MKGTKMKRRIGTGLAATLLLSLSVCSSPVDLPPIVRAGFIAAPAVTVYTAIVDANRQAIIKVPGIEFDDDIAVSCWVGFANGVMWMIVQPPVSCIAITWFDDLEFRINGAPVGWQVRVQIVR